MHGKWKIFFGFVIAAVIAVLGAWHWYFRPISLNEAMKAELASLSLSSWVLDAGPKPEDWNTRAYLPTSALQKLGSALVGLEFVSRNGKPNSDERYDGAFIIRLDRFSLETEASQLRPSLDVSVRYEGDLHKPWWGGAVLQMKLRAEFLPVVVLVGENKTREVRLRVVPTRVEPGVPLNPIGALSVGRLLSEIIAGGVLIGYGEQLTLAAPALTEKLEVEVKVDSNSRSDFDKGGGFDLIAKLGGPTFARPIEAKMPLVTSRGIWMLDVTGKTLPEPAAIAGDPSFVSSRIEALRRLVAGKIRPFERADDVVEVRLSNRPLLSIADDIAAHPSAYKIAISSSNASGTMAEAFLLKDKFLGDIGVKVRPRVSDFLSGDVQLKPPKINWVAGRGLETTVNADARALASINVHLSTGNVGGGIGKDIDIRGETDGGVPVSLKIEKRNVEAGTALVLQPEVGCTRIEIDLNPTSRDDIIKEAWIALKPIGVRLKRNVGGGRQTPSVLLTDHPTLQRFGEKDTEPATLKGKQSFLRPKYVNLGWMLDDVQVQSDGLLARAGVSVEPGPALKDYAAMAEEQLAKREKLKAALKESAPKIECEPKDNYSLIVVGNQVEIGENNEVVRYIKRVFEEGKHVAEESKKELEKFYKTPFKSIVDLPDNTIREAGKAAENITKAAEKAAADVAKAGKDFVEDVGNAVCGFLGC